jgi:hypothetical protein
VNPGMVGKQKTKNILFLFFSQPFFLILQLVFQIHLYGGTKDLNPSGT